MCEKGGDVKSAFRSAGLDFPSSSINIITDGSVISNWVKKAVSGRSDMLSHHFTRIILKVHGDL